MRGATLFSGIGAPECAAPWVQWQWSAEIDPFASAVHAARFPGMPNLGNVEGIDADAIEPVDLVVFGSPCQSFSVAGRRLGLDDPRGNLALVALRLVERLRPRWFVFENVPGLLSSDGGRDFGAFLGTVALSVRRLTPREAERLQGFPDDFTAVTYRGKPAADGPRYRALGNSMAVPVIGWVLGRIRAFEERAER